MAVPRIEVRDEKPDDVAAIREVNRQAFDQDLEGRIVDALRANGAATLSLVAVDGGAVVGHIMFSSLSVGTVAGVGLGPMAVLPSHQRQGIGSRLVEAGLERLRNAGYPFVVVLGHPSFYPRFGFEPAAAHGVTCEWDVPSEAFMVNILNPAVSGNLRGGAQYRAEFSMKPDFSGEWTLNRQASTLSPGAEGIRSAVWHIEHCDPTFHHKASFVTSADPIQWEYELPSDGREVVAAHEGVTTVSSIRWDGDALVVTMRIQRADGEMSITFRHELLEGGRCLRAAEQLRGTDHDQDNVWVFDRR
jgi:putative acetyltransferase